MKISILVIVFFFSHTLIDQNLRSEFPELEDRIRLKQLKSDSNSYSFFSRPLSLAHVWELEGIWSMQFEDKPNKFTVLPALSTIRVTTKRSYGYADCGMISKPGSQFFYQPAFIINIRV